MIWPVSAHLKHTQFPPLDRLEWMRYARSQIKTHALFFSWGSRNPRRGTTKAQAQAPLSRAAAWPLGAAARPSSPGRPAAGHTKEQPACVLSRCWSGAPDLEYRGAAVRDEIRGAVPDLKQSCDGTSFKFGMYQTRSPPYFANRLIQVDVQSAIVDQGWAALAPIRTYVIHFWAGSSRAGERRLTCFIISICLISWSEN
jgi:hypothetical protein